jgi:hypothetical protein
MRLFVKHNGKTVYITHPHTTEFKTRYDVMLKWSKSFTITSCGDAKFSANDVFAEVSVDNRWAGAVIGFIVGLFLLPVFGLAPILIGGLAYGIEQERFEDDLKKVAYFNNHVLKGLEKTEIKTENT